MLLTFRPKTPLFSIFKPKPKPKTLNLTLDQTLTLTMSAKRPTCPSCTRPTKLCLCTKFKTPILDNTISVTVLQHNLEKKHPLNSARIASLGLKNITIVRVSDVLNEAQFQIQCIGSNADMGQNGSVQEYEKIESLHVIESNGDLGRKDLVENSEKIESSRVFESNGDVGQNGSVQECEKIESLHVFESNGVLGRNDLVENSEKIESLRVFESNGDVGQNGSVQECEKIESLHVFESNGDLGQNDLVENSEKIESLRVFESNGDVGQNGSVQECEKIESLHVFESTGDPGQKDSVKNSEKNESLSICDSNADVGRNDLVENGEKMESLQSGDVSFTTDKKGVIIKDYGFDNLLVNQTALRNGFTVKKLRQGNDGKCVEEYDIKIGPGSLLLFPSEGSIGVEDIGFDVKNLIVLDGTWRKATRMYKENPWLKLVPHLKLDIDQMSLYAEVRRQPKAGYLSSIESIVYAMKAIGGEDVEKLESLLDVFESMVVDQRRCKNEALKLAESNVTSM